MNADKYLRVYLGGNMNVATLKPLAISEFAESYFQHRLEEFAKLNKPLAATLFKGEREFPIKNPGNEGLIELEEWAKQADCLIDPFTKAISGEVVIVYKPVNLPSDELH